MLGVTDPLTGARRQEVRGGFRTDLEAWQARCAREGERDGRVGSIGRDVTVEAWVNLWIDSRVRARESTTVARQAALRLYIAPHLGHVPLRDLTITHVEAWVRTLMATRSERFADATRTTRATLSPGTIKNAHDLLNAALAAAAAVENGYIQRNVARRVSLPEVKRHAEIGWTAAHAQRFIDGIRDNDLEALWLLALLAFMRPGELRGLHRSDMRLERGIIDIQHTAASGAGRRPMLNPPKTRHSAAPISPPQPCIDALYRHEERQRFIYRHNPAAMPDLVFPGRASNGTLAEYTLNRRLTDLCKEMGLPHVTPHDLRHVGATLAIRAGADPAVVSRMLRHHSTAFTLDVYVESTMRDMEQAGAALVNFITKQA